MSPYRSTLHKSFFAVFILLSLLLLVIGCTTTSTETAASTTLSTDVQTLPTIAKTAVPVTTISQPPTPGITPSVTPTATQTPISPNTPTATITPTPSPTPCTQPGRMEYGFFPSAIAGETSYRIYLPPCYEENGQIYPTLYMLAGNTYTDALWDQIGLDEAAEEGIHNGNLPPLIIVMPYSGETALYTSGGPGSYETVISEELTSYIETTYCSSSDPAYRALGGVSRGGYWALEIAFRHPEAFLSVGGHSAALLDEYAKPDINPQYTALTSDLGDLRIYLDIGDQDWVRNNTLQLHADMEAANLPHTWVLNTGAHEEAYWQQHVSDYLVWYSEPWSLNRQDYPPCPEK